MRLMDPKLAHARRLELYKRIRQAAEKFPEDLTPGLPKNMEQEYGVRLEGEQHNPDFVRRHTQKYTDKWAEHQASALNCYIGHSLSGYKRRNRNKDATSVRKREHRETNKDAINARKREYYRVNKEAISAQRRERREANKDAILAWHQEYYRANKEAISAQRREHYRANKDAILAQQREHYRAKREAQK